MPVNSGNAFQWAEPHTWPWPIYVWLALMAAGWLRTIWKWSQRNRAKSWPITSGQIESVTVNSSKPFFISFLPRGNSGVYKAEIGYLYSVAGNVESGFYKREFGTEKEAEEFLRDLKGKSLGVHYNPAKPSNSTLSEPSIETLLQTRTPLPVGEMFSLGSGNQISPLLSRFLWVFVVLSAVGLVVSLWVHLGAVAGRRVAPEDFFWILHVGIFIVWFPAVAVSIKRVGNTRRKDYWKAVLSGSPEWMRYMMYGFFVYAAINFLLFLGQAPADGGGGETPAIVWRGFSGHWMAFYSAALAILYSAARTSQTTRRCINGHPISQNSSFCATCGQPAAHT